MTGIDTDSDNATAKEGLRVDGGKRRVFTVLFPDGSAMVEPSGNERAQKLRPGG